MYSFATGNLIGPVMSSVRTLVAVYTCDVLGHSHQREASVCKVLDGSTKSAFMPPSLSEVSLLKGTQSM